MAALETTAGNPIEAPDGLVRLVPDAMRFLRART